MQKAVFALARLPSTGLSFRISERRSEMHKQHRSFRHILNIIKSVLKIILILIKITVLQERF